MHETFRKLPPRCERFNHAKTTYRSKAAAERARVKISSHNGGRKMYAFECPYCQQWHLTEQVQRNARRRRKSE